MKIKQTYKTFDVESLLGSILAISTEMNYSELSGIIVAVIKEKTGAKRVVIIENNDDELVVRKDSGFNIENPVVLADYEDLPNGLIMDTAFKKKPVIVEEPHKDTNYSKDKYLTKSKPRSVLIYQVLSKKKLAAVLYLEHSKTNPFTKEKLDVLGILAEHAVLSLKKADKYEELKTHSKTLEKRVTKCTAELEKTNRELESISLLDELTGVANRKHFYNVLESEWDRMEKKNKPFALILLDIDYFKKYNDTYGHEKGDSCLKLIAQKIADHVQRTYDLVARYGEEEFAILLPSTDISGAWEVADGMKSMIASLAIEHKSSEVSSHITASFGVSVMDPKKGGDHKMLVKHADIALSQAKKKGRNRMVQFKETSIS